MSQINNIEKFSNCTHLCKPHESNKILYQIKSNKENPDYIKDLKEKTTNISKTVKHKNFI